MSSRNCHYRGASVINSWCHRGATQSIHGTYYRAVFNVCILSHHYWVFIMTTQVCSFLEYMSEIDTMYQDQNILNIFPRKTET